MIESHNGKEEKPMKIVYFDCFSGISGDMTLGALLDLGLSQDLLTQELKKLPLDGYELKIGKSVKRGISGTDVQVLLVHAHEHGHPHNEDHDHSHHEHRSYKDIRDLIEGSTLQESVKAMSIRIFVKLAQAEGKIHDKPPEEVHFHEVGAVDSIVDIVGTAILLDSLSAERYIASPLPMGSGMVRCQHGLIPVPAPAVLELLKGIPIYSKNIRGEMVTPTGAAVIAALCTEFGDFPAMTVEAVGYGMGKKDFEIPNCLRVCVGEALKK